MDSFNKKNVLSLGFWLPQHDILLHWLMFAFFACKKFSFNYFQLSLPQILVLWRIKCTACIHSFITIIISYKFKTFTTNNDFPQRAKINITIYDNLPYTFPSLQSHWNRAGTYSYSIYMRVRNLSFIQKGSESIIINEKRKRNKNGNSEKAQQLKEVCRHHVMVCASISFIFCQYIFILEKHLFTICHAELKQ